MKWGDFQVHLLDAGSLWLDGGAMFGVVPKVLWEKSIPPDEKNRIPLALHCLLVQAGDTNILVDTGCGEKYSEKEQEIYRIQLPQRLPQALGRLGLQPQDIHHVVNTHLHFDHCGGNTWQSSSGEVLPTFPNALYWVRRREYEDATHPNERTLSTYRAHNWEVLRERGQLRLVEEDQQIVPGVELVGTPGHTLGHQSVRVFSGGKTLFYIADLCPTLAHVPLAWVMAFDLFPLTTMEVRKKIYDQAIREEWLIVFEHEMRQPAAYLRFSQGRYQAQPVPWEKT